MHTTVVESAPHRNNALRLVGALVVFACAVGFLWAQYAKVRPANVAGPIGTPRLSAAAGAPGSMRPPGPPSPEERRQMREAMLAGLELTADQQAQIAALDKKLEKLDGPEAWQARREGMENILTPEQRDTVRARMEMRRNARLMERIKVLPPDQQVKFIQKLEQRRAERAARGDRPGGPGGRRDGGGFGGGPGFGGPPPGF